MAWSGTGYGTLTVHYQATPSPKPFTANHMTPQFITKDSGTVMTALSLLLAIGKKQIHNQSGVTGKLEYQGS